jgi:hypothetical protein
MRQDGPFGGLSHPLMPLMAHCPADDRVTPNPTAGKAVVRDDSGMSAAAGIEAPASGYAVLLTLDGAEHALYWGEDDSGRDRFATLGGRLARWDDLASLDRDAAANGWDLQPIADVDTSQVVDLERVRRWARGGLGPIDAHEALMLWNIATDVAHSLALTFRDRGHLERRCYDKLFAANLPWVFDLSSYRPVWTPRELRALGRVLAEAVHLVRRGIQPVGLSQRH